MATLYEYTDDSGGSGEFISGVAGQDLGEHKLVYLGANSRWYLADADDANKMPVIGLTLGVVPSGRKGRYLLKGYIADSSWAWSIGGPTGLIYASATAGELTQTPPGGTIVAVAIAKAATGILFCFPSVGGGGGATSDPEHTVSYIIWTDGLGNYYAKDGHTGVVTNNANFAALFNSLTLTTGQSVFLKKSLNPTDYTFPDTRVVALDYVITTTINLPSGVSLLSDGATIDARTLNDNVILVNPTGEAFWIENMTAELSGFAVVGSDVVNANSVGIYVNAWSSGIRIRDVTMFYLGSGITINGECYCSIIDGAVTDRCTKGIRVIRDTGAFYANGLTISHGEFQSCTSIAVEVIGGIPVRVQDSYFEYNPICIVATGATIITGNYLQPSTGYIGIYSTGDFGIISNNLWILDTNSIGLKINRDYSSAGEVTGNNFYCQPGAIAIKTDGVIQSSIKVTGNHFTLFDPTSYGIYGKFYQSSITGNKFVGAGIGIYLTASWNSITGNSFSGVLLGINITNSSYYNTIVSNVFAELTGALTLSGDGSTVVGNYFSGVVIIGGTGHVIGRNKGYITESFGTATVDATTLTEVVTHGLSVTPNLLKIHLVPQDDLNGRSIWVSTPTATEFTINMSTIDAVNHEIGWSYGE